MAHLWIRLRDAKHGVLTLHRDRYELPAAVLRALDREDDTSRAATLLRLDQEHSWALIVDRGRAVEVNGFPVAAGIAILEDRDEIRLAEDPPIWFSTEVLAQVEPAPLLAGRPCRCPRCGDSIDAGSPAVSCPQCGVFSHEMPDRACFTYHNAPCAACGELVELDGTFRWTPEEI